MISGPSVNFGFELHNFTKVDETAGDDRDACLKEASETPRKAQEQRSGLGRGLGGQLARSYLGLAGSSVVDVNPRQISRRMSNCLPTPTASQCEAFPSAASLSDEPELEGFFLGLVLNDVGSVAEAELEPVKSHRWTFKGAEDLAAKGKGFYFFVQCLLEMQRNVQLSEEGDVLEPQLMRACRTFVTAQCRRQKMGEMYQVLTHFLSNSLLFHEWARFLESTFDDPRANQESYLAPYLEQVWKRFSRFREVVEVIFGVLNGRFVRVHRLPRVEDLVLEQMKRRCFSSDQVLRNEVLLSEKSGSAAVKAVTRAFNLR
mmetsp:Transcript_70824/g.153811  ORF Transcript_70824/g.153811 Transcript_70824/m.153811 type:complete len:316 (-) Transcript_70824:59-1006(-)